MVKARKVVHLRKMSTIGNEKKWVALIPTQCTYLAALRAPVLLI